MNERLEGTDYDMKRGTSFASPIVAGSIALLMSTYPNKNPLEIREILLSSAEKTEIHTENSMEWRRLNLANAMKLAEKRIDLKSELSGNIIADNSKWTNNNVKLTIKSNKEILDIGSWKKFLKTIKILTPQYKLKIDSQKSQLYSSKYW